MKLNKLNLNNYLNNNKDLLINDNNNIKRLEIINIKQFIGGLSNPTYLIEFIANNNNNNNYKLVLRKKPPGILLKGAHLINREYKVMKILASLNYPVPQTYCYCNDTNILGTEFYLMEFVDGIIYRDPSLPTLNEIQRQNIYKSAIEVLQQLHSIDINTTGLKNLTKKANENFVSRQIISWSKNYKKGAYKKISIMDDLISIMPKNVPNQNLISIVHNDFRIDNIVFEKNGSSKVLAVLDWELVTIGDPLVDLANFSLLSTYEFTGLARIPSSNSISMNEILQIYCLLAQISYPIKEWDKYIAFILFRSSAICAGVVSRTKLGQMSQSNITEEIMIEWCKDTLKYLKPSLSL